MPLRIGHRGAAGHAPENTITSVNKAIALKADFIEVDVQRSSDGHLVIMHDKRVDRTTHGKGYVSALTLHEIRGLHFRLPNAGDEERVPTLEEVLEVAERCVQMAERPVGLVLELISTGIAAQVYAKVRERGFRGPVIYASFLHSELLKVRNADPKAKTMALLEGVPVSPTSFATEAGATHVGLALDSITEPFVGALKSAGLQVFVYTVNDPADIQWVKSLGVDGIVSDFPEKV